MKCPHCQMDVAPAEEPVRELTLLVAIRAMANGLARTLMVSAAFAARFFGLTSFIDGMIGSVENEIESLGNEKNTTQGRGT